MADSTLQNLKEISSMVAPVVGIVMALLIYIWNRQVKSDEKSFDKAEKQIKEWVELRESYIKDALSRLDDSITNVEKRLDTGNKELAKLTERIEGLKERCDERHDK